MRTGGAPISFNADKNTLEFIYYPEQRIAGSWDALDPYAPYHQEEVCHAPLNYVARCYRKLVKDFEQVRKQFIKSIEDDGYSHKHEVMMFATHFYRAQAWYSTWCGRDLSGDCELLLQMSDCEIPAHMEELGELGPILWVSYLLSGEPQGLVKAPPEPDCELIISGINDEPSEAEKEPDPEAVKRWEERKRVKGARDNAAKRLKSLVQSQSPGIPPIGLYFPVKELPFRQTLGIDKDSYNKSRGSAENSIANSVGVVVRRLMESITIIAAPGIRNPLENERNDNTSLIAQLAGKSDNQSDFPLPGGVALENPSVLSALNAWLAHLGLSQIHNFGEDTRGETYAVMMEGESSQPGMLLNDQGEGARQVIYILIQAMLARPSDILVWQQPEVHLHPAAETRMAEFALALESIGMSVLIETHSTHLLDGLRLGVLERRNEMGRQKAKGAGHPALDILFFSTEGGCSRVEQVELDKFGQIVNWPVGFLDERQDLDRRLLESYILAQRLEHNSEKEQG